MATAAEVLSALWKRAEAEGVFVTYYGQIAHGEGELEGEFHPNPHRRRRPQPRIVLYRTPPPQPQHQPALSGPHMLFDACTLAHEHGHFRSWKDSADGTASPWPDYFQAASARDSGATLTTEQRRLIIEEEERAWETAARTLRELGFDEWPELERRKVEGLNQHRTRLEGVRLP